jgi:hypothetical protein
MVSSAPNIITFKSNVKNSIMIVKKIMCKAPKLNASVQHLILPSSRYHYNTDNGQALNTANKNQIKYAYLYKIP